MPRTGDSRVGMELAPIIGMKGIGSGVIALGLVGSILAWRQSRRPGEISGKVAVVTGGSRGLGFLLARKLALQKCTVVICARNADTLERARTELLRATGAEVLAIPADVADQVQVDRVIQTALSRFGSVDILVNNAGVIQVGPVETMTLDDFRQAMDLMYWGMVYASLAVLPHMRSRGWGRIVNITSIGGKISVPHLVPYSGAKFAAVGFSQGLAAEVRDAGIRVTNCSPGLMHTGSYLHVQFTGRQADELTFLGDRRQPAHHLHGCEPRRRSNHHGDAPRGAGSSTLHPSRGRGHVSRALPWPNGGPACAGGSVHPAERAA